MTESVLLVDYENVQSLDLSRLPEDARVVVVLGPNQKSLPAELVVRAQSLGERFVYIPIKSQQTNGVDFCIAFYLGSYLTKDPSAEYIILSRDKKGFDPLVQHLSTQPGLRVRRVDSQADAFPSLYPATAKTATNAKSKSKAAGNGVSTQDADFARTLELLKKDKARPKKKKSLEGKLKSWFSDKSPKSLKGLLNRLINEKYISESDGTLVYPKFEDAQ